MASPIEEVYEKWKDDWDGIAFKQHPVGEELWNAIKAELALREKELLRRPVYQCFRCNCTYQLPVGLTMRITGLCSNCNVCKKHECTQVSQ